jgi:phage-related tail protein
MYFHPLQEEIGNMSEEDISKRIKELFRKVNTAKRFGRNPDMLAQLQHALATYQNAIRERRLEAWVKKNKKLRNEPDIGDLINME